MATSVYWDPDKPRSLEDVPKATEPHRKKPESRAQEQFRFESRVNFLKAFFTLHAKLLTPNSAVSL